MLKVMPPNKISFLNVHNFDIRRPGIYFIHLPLGEKPQLDKHLEYLILKIYCSTAESTSTQWNFTAELFDSACPDHSLDEINEWMLRSASPYEYTEIYIRHTNILSAFEKDGKVSLRLSSENFVRFKEDQEIYVTVNQCRVLYTALHAILFTQHFSNNKEKTEQYIRECLQDLSAWWHHSEIQFLSGKLKAIFTVWLTEHMKMEFHCRELALMRNKYDYTTEVYSLNEFPCLNPMDAERAYNALNCALFYSQHEDRVRRKMKKGV